MEQRILCVRHENDPTDDRITSWCGRHGYEADIRRPYLGHTLGDITDDLAGIVIYGGNYNAYDTGLHAFLNDEYRVIDAAMRAGTPLLGLCQGAQMIAHHMGAFAGAPRHGQHEFGYYEVSPTEDGWAILPKPMFFTQAHFHTFDIPSGADTFHAALHSKIRYSASATRSWRFSSTPNKLRQVSGDGRHEVTNGAATTNPAYKVPRCKMP